MANIYYTLLTDVGAAAMAYGAVNGEPVVLCDVALGDGNGSVPAPTRTSTALVNEVYRAGINSITLHQDNPSWYIVELVVPPDVGGFTVREFRIDDAAGNAIYIGNMAPETKPVLPEGMTRDSIYRLIVETSNAATINLTVDNSIVIATHQYVTDRMDEHLADADPHPQYAKDTDLQAHVEASDPHPQYAKDTDLADHEADVDPHPQYLTAAELVAYLALTRKPATRSYFANI
ncbi:MAG: phage tail protein [Nitrosomonas sp.]|uniref:phage tail protein n=1 Tax=Nitrosomonas sp. TaxID=42353 RepID=UPI0025E14E2B|nr:phage tail protein [Nitrosomonas sp.]MBY0475371.1 phage tail protein [Nitrosomonas sp.]